MMAPTYFLHIPKTAGMSMQRALWSAFDFDGTTAGRAMRSGADRLDLADTAVEHLDDIAALDLAYGHLGTWPLAALRSRGDVRTVTVLRDPVEQVLSYWAHQQRDISHFRHRYVVGEDLPLEDYLEHPHLRAVTSNSQARWLLRSDGPPTPCHADPRDPFPLQTAWEVADNGYSDEELLAAASEVLRTFDVVLTTERSADAHRLLRSALGTPLVSPLPSTNTNPSRLASAELPADLLAQIRAANRVDHALWELATELMDDDMSGLDDDVRPPGNVAWSWRPGQPGAMSGWGHPTLVDDDWFVPVVEERVVLDTGRTASKGTFVVNVAFELGSVQCPMTSVGVALAGRPGATHISSFRGREVLASVVDVNPGGRLEVALRFPPAALEDGMTPNIRSVSVRRVPPSLVTHTTLFARDYGLVLARKVRDRLTGPCS